MELTPKQKKIIDQINKIKKKNLFYVSEYKIRSKKKYNIQLRNNRLINIAAVLILFLGLFGTYKLIMPEFMKTNILEVIVFTEENESVGNSEQVKTLKYYKDFFYHCRIYQNYGDELNKGNNESDIVESIFILKHIDESINEFSDYNLPYCLEDENEIAIKYLISVKQLAQSCIDYTINPDSDNYNRYISNIRFSDDLNETLRNDMICNFEKYDICYEVYENGIINY